MAKIDKPIRLSQHAIEQSKFRGATDTEIRDTIFTTEWNSTKSDRWECRKNFEFNKEWNGKFYKIKQVRPIFTEKSDEIIVITVYVYYF